MVVGLAWGERAVDRQRAADPEEGIEPPLGVGTARSRRATRSGVLPACRIRRGHQPPHFGQRQFIHGYDRLPSCSDPRSVMTPGDRSRPRSARDRSAHSNGSTRTPRGREPPSRTRKGRGPVPLVRPTSQKKLSTSFGAKSLGNACGVGPSRPRRRGGHPGAKIARMPSEPPIKQPS